MKVQLSPSDSTRFWQKVDKTPGLGKNGDCWLWTSQLRNGYGLFRFQGKPVSAHRLSYSLKNDLDETLQVCHSCDTPACVRPEHLFQGTAKVNGDDKHMKDRHGFTLSNEQVMEMRGRPITITMAKDLAKEFNVSVNTVKKALTGESYAWLPGAIELPPQYTGTRFTLEEVKDILKELENAKWGTQSRLAEKYGVHRSHISNIANGWIGYADTIKNMHLF